MYPTFNDIGEMLARRIPNTIDADKIPNDNVMIREGIFTRHENSYILSNKGIENVIARKLDFQGEAVHTANVCVFGTKYGREVCYTANPQSNFYGLYGRDTSLILGSNAAEPPRDWSGTPVLLSALMTVRDGRVALVQNALKKLIPEAPAGSLKKKIRPSNDEAYDRMIAYTGFFIDHIIKLQKTTSNPRGNAPLPPPKLGAAHEWIHRQGFGISKKTVSRDLKYIESYNTTANDKDERLALAATISRRLTDPKFVFGEKTVDAIIAMVSQLDVSDLRINTSLAAATSLWESKNNKKHSGGNQVIATDSAIDVDRDLRTL